jgi:NADH-quinone oxidoreductase subunit N
VVAIVAVASMCAGNFLALQQTHVKRILAYSSIAHFGYILVAFLAAGTMAIEAVSFYVTAYTVTILVAFGIVTVLSGAAGDADQLDSYRGLFWRRPVIAAVFTAALLSLAGIPGTIGFVGKFYVLAAGAAARAWPLMLILVVTSVAGLFYYLRIIVALYAAAPEGAPIEATARRGASAAALVLTILLIGLGVFPAQLLNLIRTTTMAGLDVAASVPDQPTKDSGFSTVEVFAREEARKKKHRCLSRLVRSGCQSSSSLVGNLK